jgi:DNA-binding transcriptional MerR regulator
MDTVLLTTADAARQLGVTPGGVRAMARTARLPIAVRTVSGQRLYRASDVDALIAERADRARYLTTAQVAVLLARTPASVRAMARTDRLPVAQVTDGGVRLFRRCDVEAIIARRSTLQPLEEHECFLTRPGAITNLQGGVVPTKDELLAENDALRRAAEDARDALDNVLADGDDPDDGAEDTDTEGDDT